MNDTLETLYHIADSIRETGNDPHDQLYGYVSTGDATYITRRNNARELIQSVDLAVVSQYVKELELLNKLKICFIFISLIDKYQFRKASII